MSDDLHAAALAVADELLRWANAGQLPAPDEPLPGALHAGSASHSPGHPDVLNWWDRKGVYVGHRDRHPALVRSKAGCHDLRVTWTVLRRQLAARDVEPAQLALEMAA